MTPNQLLAACHAGDGGIGYEIEKSLRFRSSSLPSLSKNYGVSPADTNGLIKTFSVWVKRGTLGTSQFLMSINNGSTNYWYIGFNASNQLVLNKAVSSTVVINKVTTQLFRDVSAWYHILVTTDMTASIAEERIKLYVNGTRVSSWATNTVPAQNGSALLALSSGSGTNSANIGNYSLNNSNIFDGYLAEMHFVDGQALTPSYFGEWSQESGQWVPVRYTGVYGANGFYLDFKDNSALTNLGYDKSGLNNHWTPNNFSLTSGATYDSMLDTPSNNYAIASILKNFVANFTVNNAGLSLTDSTTVNINRAATLVIPTSGQWYWETTITSQPSLGSIMIGAAVESAITSTNGVTSNGCYRSNGVLYEFIGNGIVSSSLPTYTVNDIIGVAVDHVNGQISYYKNNVLAYTRPMGAGLSLIPIWSADNVAGTKAMHINFGQRPFAYTPPTGFKALCSKNLPTPAIKRGETGFDVVTYTGNGGNQQVGEYQFPRFNYLIDRSLRFKGINSYLSRTPGTVGNRTTWTWSSWVKRSNIAGNTFGHEIFGAYAIGTPGTVHQHKITFNPSTNSLTFTVHDGSSHLGILQTSRNFLNIGEWTHIVAIFDTTNATAADRMKLYINGIRVVNFALSINAAQNLNGYINSTAYVHQLGAYRGYTEYNLNGYMAEVHFIDGQALDPTAFGEWDINGYWIPKAYGGTYGQNGFYLDFEDTSALANLGFDKSGRGNNWAVNNFSLTAGINYDSMTDSPTQNYAVLDPNRTSLGASSTLAITNGGLSVALGSGINQSTIFASLGFLSGKFYIEFICNNAGSAPASTGIQVYSTSYMASGIIAGGAAFGASYSSNDLIGVAIDFDIGEVSYYKNNVLQGIQIADKAFLKHNTNSHNFAHVALYVAGLPSGSFTCNFGQRPFVYTPPEGFKTLSIPNIAEYNQDLESPDLVWIKCRNAAQNHMLFDSVRGATKYLSSNLTAAEATDVNSLVSFNKNGFYLGNNANVNTLNNTYIAWMWKANQTPVANNDGTIASQVRVNRDLGFSVVQYTGDGSPGATVGHGLGVVPDIMLVKNTGSAYNWHIYHKNADANPATGVMVLNLTQAFVTYSPAWNNTLPTSSVFSLGDGIGVNESAKNHIAYCFSEVEGFSKFGLYVGNGSADGPFVYCGFKPRWIMYKGRGEVGGWGVYDTELDADNIVTVAIVAQSTSAELVSSYIDILSNGFKLRNSSVSHNTNGIGYIFMAFAECPFKYSTAK